MSRRSKPTEEQRYFADTDGRLAAGYKLAAMGIRVLEMMKELQMADPIKDSENNLEISQTQMTFQTIIFLE
jgi:hypothetical protein